MAHSCHQRRRGNFRNAHRRGSADIKRFDHTMERYGVAGLFPDCEAMSPQVAMES